MNHKDFEKSPAGRLIKAGLVKEITERKRDRFYLSPAIMEILT